MAKNSISVVAPPNKPAERWVPSTLARVTELQASRRAKVEEIISLEKAGVVARPRPLAESPAAKAARLLDGAPDPEAHAPVRDDAFRLHELREELIVIDRAIELGLRRAQVEQAERAQYLAAQNASAWKALQHKRALAVMALFKANRQIDAMRSEINGGCAGVNLELDGFSLKLFGAYAEQNVTGHWAREFLKQAVKAGAISEKEIADNV